MIKFILAFKNNIGGGSASGSVTIQSTDIIVSGHSNPDVNGTYKLVNESATGYDRRWVKDGNPLFQIYSCYSLAGHDWVLDFDGDFVCGSGFEIGIDNPVDIQTWVDPNGWGTPPKFEWAVEKYQNNNSNDKTYSYTVTKAPNGYEDAIGNYYSATPEEMMELYPQTTSYTGGQYYINGKGWMLCLSEGMYEWAIYKYYPNYEGGDYWKWDHFGMCSSSTLPDTGNWTGGYDVVTYS